MTSRTRSGIVAAAVVVLVAGFLIARGSDDTSTKQDITGAAGPAPAATSPAETGPAPAVSTAPAPPPIPTVTVVDAKPQGGVKRISVTKGDTIRFAVRSDTADEIHVHGYDVHKDVEAGGSVMFSIPAEIEGRFVVELEDHETQIAELEVTPS